MWTLCRDRCWWWPPCWCRRNVEGFNQALGDGRDAIAPFRSVPVAPGRRGGGSKPEVDKTPGGPDARGACAERPVCLCVCVTWCREAMEWVTRWTDMQQPPEVGEEARQGLEDARRVCAAEQV